MILALMNGNQFPRYISMLYIYTACQCEVSNNSEIYNTNTHLWCNNSEIYNPNTHLWCLLCIGRKDKYLHL